MDIDGEIHPTLAELRARPPQEPAVSLSCEILADLDTPVSAYLKLRADGQEPSFLLESAEGGERIARYSFVGARPRRVLRIKNREGRFDRGESFSVRDPLDEVARIIQAYGQTQLPRTPFEGGAIGYLSYETAHYFERLPSARCDPLNLPDAIFMDTDTILVFDHVARRARIVAHAWLDRPLDEAHADASGRIERIGALLEEPARPSRTLSPAGELRGDAACGNMSPAQYEEIVARAKDYIVAGDILQAVLAQRLSFPLADDPFNLYRRLRTVSPSPYMYYLDFVDHQIVGASPELLVQVNQGTVSSRPIAGTRKRGASMEEDQMLEEELLADEKERAEHLMLVDLARNDVGRVSKPGSVKVGNFMSVERFSHVMHIVSDVRGELRADCSSFDALRAAFPAGTVSGAPKIRAMQIIAELESDQRGPYAGAVGFINTRGDLEMAIAIRTGVVKDGVVNLGVGAGIVADSEPPREYVETMSKARALLEAAGIRS